MGKERNQGPGDVEITKLNLISSSGDNIDIRDVFTSIDIYEGIFNNSISGAITVLDSLSLIENMPLFGNEIVEIGVKTPSLPPEKQLKIRARIYKITDRAPLKDGTVGFVLHFVSPEMLYSAGLKISKSYKEMLISDMATDVYNNYIEPVSNKKFIVEPTTFIRSVILPSWSPFFALNWFAKNCKSEKYVGASFVFFERRDAYIFTSLEALFNVRPQASYIYGIKNTVDEKNQTKSLDDFYNAEKYKIKSSPDTLANISAGMYSAKLVSNDLVKRKMETEYFNYNDDYSDFNHTAKSKLTNNTLFNEFVTSHVTILPKQFNAFGESDEGSKLDEIIMDRKSQLQQIQNIQLEVIVPGNTSRSIGEMITFTIPSYQPTGKDDKKAPNKDEYLSGNYLITSLRHSITPENHSMMMELSGDSFNKELPKAGWRG